MTHRKHLRKWAVFTLWNVFVSHWWVSWVRLGALVSAQWEYLTLTDLNFLAHVCCCCWAMEGYRLDLWKTEASRGEERQSTWLWKASKQECLDGVTVVWTPYENNKYFGKHKHSPASGLVPNGGHVHTWSSTGKARGTSQPARELPQSTNTEINKLQV